jgi:hypothetical protein
MASTGNMYASFSLESASKHSKHYFINRLRNDFTEQGLPILWKDNLSD